MNIDIVSILIIIGLFQGILLITLLLFQKGNKSNKYLVGVLIFLFWTQLEFLLVRNKMQYDYVLLFATRLGSWLILGPIFWIYVKSVLENDFRLKIKDTLHLVPFVVFTLIVPFLIEDLLPQRAVHYGILSLLKYYHLGTTPLQTVYALLFILQFLHLLIYLVLTKDLLKAFSEKLKYEFSTIEKINKKWLNNLTNAFLIILISISTFFIVMFAFNIYEKEFDYLYVLPVAMVIYWIAFKIIKEPEIIRTVYLNNDKSKKYEKSSLTLEQAEAFKTNIESYMASHKPFLNAELKLSDLATAVNINTHHLSQVLNDQFKLSFFDFINQYRIEEAKQKLMNKNHETILQIAYEVGFNNKGSFNNYFKKITNQTPSSFIKNRLDS